MTNPEARAVCRSLAGVLAITALLSLSSVGQAQPAKPGPREQAVYQLGGDAYFYAYPIVSMEGTMRHGFHGPNALPGPKPRPINQARAGRVPPHPEAKSSVAV